MTDREKIAEFLRAWPTTTIHWDQGADAILALFADTIKDAERFRFEHSVSSVEWMLEIERKAISIPGALPIEWWREQIDEAIAAKGEE